MSRRPRALRCVPGESNAGKVTHTRARTRGRSERCMERSRNKTSGSKDTIRRSRRRRWKDHVMIFEKYSAPFASFTAFLCKSWRRRSSHLGCTSGSPRSEGAPKSERLRRVSHAGTDPWLRRRRRQYAEDTVQRRSGVVRSLTARGGAQPASCCWESRPRRPSHRRGRSQWYRGKSCGASRSVCQIHLRRDTRSQWRRLNGCLVL